MRVLLNLIWLLFGGFWLWLSYMIFGLIACIFIVTIPAGVASFRIANYVLWPFGRDVIDVNPGSAGTGIMNIVWFFVAGVWLAVSHVMTAASMAVTIIGLPLAWANLKMIPVTCFPFGKKIVSSGSYEMVPTSRGW